jgi:DNA mismatch repair protein MutL
VTELVARFAMAHPQLHFRLKHNGRTALELPPDRDGFARAQALLGPRVAARLVPATGEEDGVRVTVYLAAPELAQTTARGVQLFVGRRAVRDRGILHAVTMGYGELVPRGRYPVAVVMLDAPAGAVDVNVHPQKNEVRFADPNAVAAAVRHVVQAGISAAPWRDEAAGPMQMTAIASSAPPALPFDGPATTLAQQYARQLEKPLRGTWREDRSQTSLGLDGGGRHPASSRAWVSEVHRSTARGRTADNRAVAAYNARLQAELRNTETSGVAEPIRDEEPAVGLASGSRPTTRGYFSQLRYLGQLDLTYLVCEANGELVLVDQHSAHERVEHARLLAKSRDNDIAVQKLLFPVTIEATPAQLELATRATGLLARLGYEAEPFGKTTLAIKTVPSGIRHGDPAQLLTRLLDAWSRDGAPSDDERIAAVLAEIACHSVVRAGDRLAPGEVESLLRSLDTIDLDAPAPHGRALLLRLPLSEIGRRFGR